ncbi:acetyl-CoA C-acyltransferase [Corynebacterium poyangense]|uniref:Probable acetyl-CoA acetyltransferase n=1 Tax=Corynebacterium poyangense TaxID=2684405 RepID=A0A7H0SQI3_9CORY|nr:acetyl-CoA C-acetyltransferase [Corynebacterium poyangense]MBZ8178303.1 acetyl-CoA C-acyltransferase [Corynebacterium poyangense]QNQ90808.1 acetyl-CoA C-acyltransferase [Corynebacterium poyangense]
MTSTHADNAIVLCHPLRTPVGRYGGSLRSVPVQDLATIVVQEIISRAGENIKPEIDDLILGQATPGSAAPALGRVVALDSGLDHVPGMQLDRRCGSGLQAIGTAAAHIQAGAAELIIAGGAESMSRAEYSVDSDIRWGIKGGNLKLKDRLAEGRETAGGKNHPILGGMIETAENLREEYNIAREPQDQMAVESHQRAVAAQEDGRLAEEIVAVGDVTKDEHPRPGSTLEKLSTLRPVMKNKEGSTVTAGNASGQNDGAAAVIVTTAKKAQEIGLPIAAVLRGWAVAAVEPERMGIGPVPATAKVLERLGLSLEDMDLIELNEAFAAQALAVLQEWGISPDDPRLNPQGSGISLGHPVGATGARLVVSAAHQLNRNNQKLALVTMCIGGGQGIAAVIENPNA